MADVSKNGAAQCCYCGEKLRENALYCRKCLVPVALPSRRRRPGTVSLLLSVSLAFGGPCVWAISRQFRNEFLKDSISPTTVHAAPAPARPVNQAQLLIQSCGTPDRDVSTANNNPRPPIPFRVISYNSQQLQFAFVPGGGAKIGDPPPYLWALSGIVDTTTNQRLSPQQAAARMSCAAPVIAAAKQARANASAQAGQPAPSGSDPGTTAASDIDAQ